MRRKALRIGEREIQVINWYAIRIQHDNESYATMPEVAHALGMSPSWRVTLILNGLVDKGSLEKVPHNKVGRQLPNGAQSWGYKLKEGTFQRPPKQESKIKFTFGRANSRQMELL